MKVAAGLAKYNEAMGCWDGMLMSHTKFFMLEIPQDEALLYKSVTRVEVVSSEFPQNILFCSYLQQEQNILSDLNMHLSLSKQEKCLRSIPRLLLHM